MKFNYDYTNESGIYKIHNKINNHFYIGSAVNLKRRCAEHINRLKRKTHKTLPLLRAYEKYGGDNLEFQLVELITDISKLAEREQHYIDTLNPSYNMCRIVGTKLGVKLSQETKDKISKSNTGRKSDDIAKKHMRDAKLGKKLGYYRKNRKEISQYTKDNIFIKKWDYQQLISNELKIAANDIALVCKGKRKTAGGFIWRYSH